MRWTLPLLIWLHTEHQNQSKTIAYLMGLVRSHGGIAMVPWHDTLSTERKLNWTELIYTNILYTIYIYFYRNKGWAKLSNCCKSWKTGNLQIRKYLFAFNVAITLSKEFKRMLFLSVSRLGSGKVVDDDDMRWYMYIFTFFI